MNETVTFEPGETTMTVVVRLMGDIFPEIDKDFEVYLAASPGTYISPFGYTVVTIEDDDPPLPSKILGNRWSQIINA